MSLMWIMYKIAWILLAGISYQPVSTISKSFRLSRGLNVTFWSRSQPHINKVNWDPLSKYQAWIDTEDQIWFGPWSRCCMVECWGQTGAWQDFPVQQELHTILYMIHIRLFMKAHSLCTPWSRYSNIATNTVSIGVITCCIVPIAVTDWIERNREEWAANWASLQLAEQQFTWTELSVSRISIEITSTLLTMCTW